MRLVVKLGSSSLVGADGQLSDERISAAVSDIAATVAAGHQIVVVSSGAIATGLGLLGEGTRPTALPALQAASAIGQGAIFARWSAAFAEHDRVTAQVLLTMHDVSHRLAYLNSRNTLEQLLSWGAIPIVNENDTVATDEITFGDNDALAAQVAVQLRADALILLTDTDGLYDAHPSSPGAQRIDEVRDHSLLRQIDVDGLGSSWGTGGMRSKVVAAEMASLGGVATHIASSEHPDTVQALARGEHRGTFFPSDRGSAGSSFKLWLRYAKQARGVLHVDAGAARALRGDGRSLLPIGIAAVEGAFAAGDAVDVVDDAGVTIAKGIVSYTSDELTRMLADRDTARGREEAIHRDQMVLIDR